MGVKWREKLAKKVIQKRFRGKSEHVLDAKGRLNFPSRYREALNHYGSTTIMVTIWGKCIRLYPLDEWEYLENQLLANAGQPKIDSLIRLVVSGVTECNLDKQGRILLPASLRLELGVEKEVVLNGMLNFVEVWSKSAWAVDNQHTKDNFSDFSEVLSSIGIF